MEKLYERFRWLLDQTDTAYLRYLHGEVDWDSRMTAIVGERGVGKTTMLLQHIKFNLNLSDTLYVNADDLYFADNKLFDVFSLRKKQISK